MNVTPTSNAKPHFVLIPFTAQGHMIPMIDLGLLLAQRGVFISLIITPFNAARVRTIIDRARNSGLPIDFVEIPFPCAEVGLPEGCENLDALPSYEVVTNFFEGLRMLRRPIEQYLRQHHSPPSCVINDLCVPWTRQLAESLGVPRLTFFSICTFSLLCLYNLWHYKVYDSLTSPSEPFVVPGIPQRIEVTQEQAPGFFAAPGWKDFDREVKEAEFAADGIVANTFTELEPAYIELYQKAMGKKVWSLGPFSLYHKEAALMAVRGNMASIDVELCKSWLDSMKQRSVVYVSFGSLTYFTPSQLKEIGMGLEASGHPFVWVIKRTESSLEVEEWLSEGFEERTRSRGLVIKGWAPQMVILSHPAIGGIMTHCGWNSTLEGICAGVPMITWPCFGDQFLNERFIVDVLGVGIQIGVKSPNGQWMKRSEPDVKRVEVERAVRSLMDEGQEGQERRRKVEEYGLKASEAMKAGGSSYENITKLIRYISDTDKGMKRE